MSTVSLQVPRKSVRSASAAVWSSGWPRLILRRLLVLPVTLLVVVTITFIVTRLVGGNPAYRLASLSPTPKEIHAIDARLGLNHSLLHQYFAFIVGLLHGSLGNSFISTQSVGSAIISHAPATLELVFFGTALAVLLGVVFAVLSTRRPGGIIDRGLQGFSIFAFATPDFFLGAVLAFLLFYKLAWFPAPSGQLPFIATTPPVVTHSIFIDSILAGQWNTWWLHFKQLVLPCVTLGLIYFAPIFKVMRASLIEISKSEFMLYASACGLGPRMRRRYAIRHAMTLVVTYAGVTTATLIGGVVLVEQVYSWGGLSTYGVQAIQNNDYPAVQGFVVAVALLSVAIYLIVDLLYAAIDPRVRL
jgi:peptide/nickel transport system permease protein